MSDDIILVLLEVSNDRLAVEKIELSAGGRAHLMSKESQMGCDMRPYKAAASRHKYFRHT